MSVLRAASVAQTEGIGKSAVVAAIFELADRGTINMSYREDELTLSQRSAANYHLPPELHWLRSAIFGNKETVTLHRDKGALDGVRISSLNKIVTEQVVNADGSHARRQLHSAEGRLIATWLAVLNLLVIAIFAVALSPTGLIVAFVAMSIPTAVVLRRLYHQTTQLHHEDNPFIQRDDDQIGFVILTASLVSDNHQEVERAIAAWVLSDGRRRPSWWTTQQQWPQNNGRELFAAWSILWGALR